MISLIVVAACAILNRLRGTKDWRPSWLPGRSLYYVTPVVFVLSWMYVPLFEAALIAGTYLLWGSTPHGHLFTFGTVFPDREISWFEKQLLKVSKGNYYIAFWLKNFIPLLPLVFLSPILTIALSLGIVSAYFGAKAVFPDNYTWLAELLTGMFFGLFILGVSI